MTDRSRLQAQLMRHEGLRLRLYLDSVGKATIGYGRNIEDVGISRDEATYMLNGDIDRTVKALLARHPWVAELDGVRQAVLCNMAFNLGQAGLDSFVQTLRAVQQDRYEDAAAHMLESRWAEQVGSRAVELAEQMRSGRWA